MKMCQTDKPFQITFEWKIVLGLKRAKQASSYFELFKILDEFVRTIRFSEGFYGKFAQITYLPK